MMAKGTYSKRELEPALLRSLRAAGWRKRRNGDAAGAAAAGNGNGNGNGKKWRHFFVLLLLLLLLDRQNKEDASLLPFPLRSEVSLGTSGGFTLGRTDGRADKRMSGQCSRA